MNYTDDDYIGADIYDGEKAYISRERRIVNASKKGYVCDICNDIIKKGSKLRRDIRVHKDTGEEVCIFYCVECLEDWLENY